MPFFWILWFFFFSLSLKLIRHSVFRRLIQVRGNSIQNSVIYLWFGYQFRFIFLILLMRLRNHWTHFIFVPVSVRLLFREVSNTFIVLIQSWRRFMYRTNYFFEKEFVVHLNNIIVLVLYIDMIEVAIFLSLVSCWQVYLQITCNCSWKVLFLIFIFNRNVLWFLLFFAQFIYFIRLIIFFIVWILNIVTLLTFHA